MPSHASDDHKRVLLLGAGLVAPPAIDYLFDHGVSLTVAANNPERAAEMVGGRGQVVEWTLGDEETLSAMIEANDLTISLLPATMHVSVAAACVAQRKPMVTTSYVSPGMMALDEQARAAGVTLLNELGVDPGIDHMSAMRVIDEIRGRGGRLRSFRSYCGGLPAPEANDNPWGYKFSWSPMGVLRATASAARFVEQGTERKLPSERVFAETTPLEVGGMRFEAYANRDSLDYISTYRLDYVETMLRGTLRWPGWAATMRSLRALGLLSDEPMRAAPSWPAAIAERAGLELTADPARQAAAHLAAATDAHGAPLLTATEVEQVIDRLRWLGLLDEGSAPVGATAIEALAALMEQRMAYAPGERDMIVMQHHFEAELADGARERHRSTLVVFGDPKGSSAMARTVSLPAAIAARKLLEGQIQEPGVHIPVRAAIYQPILDELESLGVIFEEEVER